MYPSNHRNRTRAARGALPCVIALPLLISPGCESMKEAFSGMSKKADEAVAEAGGSGPGHTGGATPDSHAATAGGGPSGGADPGAAAAAGPAQGGSHGSDATTPTAGGSQGGSPPSGGGETSGWGGVTEPTYTNQRSDVEAGTERHSWSDAEVGWYVRYRIQGGSEMSQEVVEADADAILKETRMSMNGQVVSITRTWEPRLFPKGETGENTDTNCETETVESGEESLAIGGRTVSCEVTHTITRCPSFTTEGKVWMSDDVPGEIVKTMSGDGNGPMQVAMELIEFRK